MSWEEIELSSVAEVIRGVTFSKAESGTDKELGTISVIRAGNIQKLLILNNNLVYVPVSKIKQVQYIKKNDIIMCTSSGSANLVGKCAIATSKWNGSFGAFCVDIRATKINPLFLYFFLNYPIFKQWTQLSLGANIKNIRKSELEKFKIPLPPLKTQKHIAAILEKADQLRKDCQQMEQALNQLAQSVFIEMFGDPVLNPKGWEIVTTSNLVKGFQGGKSIVAADDDSIKYKNRVLKISAVTSGYFKPLESKPLPDDYSPPMEHFVNKGDLLFSRANTTELVGATTLVFEDHKNLLLPDKLWRFEWKDELSLSPIFIWQLLNNEAMRRQISKLSTGSGGSMKNISKAKLKTLKLPFPPLDQQQKYEKFYISLRAGYQSNITLINQYETLFNALSQKAFKGELKDHS